MAGDPNTKLEGAGAAVEFGRAVQEQVERVVVGKADQTRLLIIALLADGHVLLDDVPGVAKTLLVRTLSAALSLSFTRTREALGSLGEAAGAVVGGLGRRLRRRLSRWAAERRARRRSWSACATHSSRSVWRSADTSGRPA